MAAAARSRCRTETTVRPALSRRRVALMASSVLGSRALVASSSRSSLGLRTIARAMAIRCFWPPERRPPPEPTGVRKPSGRIWMRSPSSAARAASSTS